MTIWEHAHHVRSLGWLRNVAYERNCVFCGEPLIKRISEKSWDKSMLGPGSIKKDVYVCHVCGWWRVLRQSYYPCTSDDPNDSDVSVNKAAAGALKEFPLLDLDIPVIELRAYLSGLPEKRFMVTPKLIEETVVSVFRSSGYNVEETQYSKDGGIDAIIYGDDQKPVPIQVKAPRSEKKVQVNTIREFLGAMLLDSRKKGIDYTKGVFVTMGGYTLGAKNAAELCGVELELFDAKRFFDILRVAQRNDYEDSDLESLTKDDKLTQIWTSF